jgi:phosphohistidine phosphatase SixA
MVNNYDNKYYKKYIKYKNKYLQYKRILYGGTQPPQPQPSQPPQPQPSQSPLSVIILASHQNTMGEFLSILVTNFTKTRKKFKNCACLEIAKVDDIVRVSMVHEGELDQQDKKKDPKLYFTIEEFNEQNYKFKKEYPPNIDVNIGDNVKILLVRHGNGPHNAHTGLEGAIVKLKDEETYTDSLLTLLGINQAERASISIIKKIRTYGKCTIKLCSSRLRRAIQTAGIIGYHLSIPQIQNVSMELRVIIIPGVEEIVDSKGNTEKKILSIGLNPENRSICPIGSNMPKNCDNLFLTTTPATPTTLTTTINKIDFHAFDGFTTANDDSAYIPVDFTYMLQYKKTIFPFSTRINTAFNKLEEVIQTSEMPVPFMFVGGSNKNKHK